MQLGYYNLYKLALWNPMKHQKKMKSVILFGKRNLNFFLRKPFKKKDLIFYAPYCWLWISLTLFMFPVWHKLLSSLKRTQISNAHWRLDRSFLLLSFLTSTGCKVIGSYRKTKERKTNYKHSNSHQDLSLFYLQYWIFWN